VTETGPRRNRRWRMVARRQWSIDSLSGQSRARATLLAWLPAAGVTNRVNTESAAADDHQHGKPVEVPENDACGCGK
jgi:hypothetical protein